MWEVKRHGGRVSDVYRLVVGTTDENRARKVFDRESTRLRQGGVVLIHEGKIVSESRAPRLRSRW